MLKFLFGGKKATPEVVIETDRARFTRLVEELNDMIDTLAVKPPVTVDPATGHVLPETPEQFADEALALPAPDTEAEAVPGAETEEVSEVDPEDEPTPAAKPEAPVATPPVPNPPTPAPPKAR